MKDKVFWKLIDDYENKEITYKQVVEKVYSLNDHNFHESLADLKLIFINEENIGTVAKIYLKQLSEY